MNATKKLADAALATDALKSAYRVLEELDAKQALTAVDVSRVSKLAQEVAALYRDAAVAYLVEEANRAFDP